MLLSGERDGRSREPGVHSRRTPLNFLNPCSHSLPYLHNTTFTLTFTLCIVKKKSKYQHFKQSLSFMLGRVLGHFHLGKFCFPSLIMGAQMESVSFLSGPLLHTTGWPSVSQRDRLSWQTSLPPKHIGITMAENEHHKLQRTFALGLQPEGQSSPECSPLLSWSFLGSSC